MKKHPAGLYVLFFTEMWERFGFYLMLAIFVLYMEDKDNGYPFLQRNYSDIYGIYLAAVYFTPFFGGLIADQVIGYRWSIILGAVGLAAGYFLLSVNSLVTFFLGLAMLVVGNGLFKPNISTMVGKIYAPGDPRIDSAFTIFYMGINLGALAAPFAAGYLRNKFSFHVAFFGAGVGMTISFGLYLLFQRWIVFMDRPAVQSTEATHAVEIPPAVQRQRHMALLIIFFVVALFWMGFKQNGSTFNLWARDCTDRRPTPEMKERLDSIGLGNHVLNSRGEFNPELSLTINPFFVVLFSPIVVWFFLKLRKYNLEPSTPAKIGWGMVLAACAFLILAYAGRYAGGDAGAVRAGVFAQWFAGLGFLDPVVFPFNSMLVSGLKESEIGRVSIGYLVAAYFVITMGELCLSPIGLSIVSKLAAPAQRSMWMGGWFVSTAVGGYLSGFVGRFWGKWSYSTFFLFLAGTSLFALVLLLLNLRYLKAAMPSERT